MTSSDIVRIVVTVAVIQFLCDLLANYRIFSTERYQRFLERLHRAEFNFTAMEQKTRQQQQQLEQKQQQQSKSSSRGNKAIANSSSSSSSNATEKQSKKLKRLQDDLANAKAMVVQQHTFPSICTSILFVVLLRILGTDYTNTIVGVLPFTPFRLLKKITQRNLVFHPHHDWADDDESVFDALQQQVCGFTFIYAITAMSVKYYVHEIFGTKPPKSADSVYQMLDSPVGKQAVKVFGIDPEQLSQYH